MKVFKFLLALLSISLLTNCKTEAKKEQNDALAKVETVSLNVSGMTCEMGCAKFIESKLAKKEGVLNANVAFADSLATIKYDANKVQKAELIAFVQGVGDGETYKACETSKKACEKTCDSKKEACCNEEKS